ncbi:MAG TPA: hypothetical protein VFN97_16665 [Actinospica sp.]|nr:hypothetical protein [Actinospica sp.]
MNRALLVAVAAAAMAVGAGTVANAATADQGRAASMTGVRVGPASSLVTAENERGDVTGAYDGWNRAFVWHKGVFTDLGLLSGTSSAYSTAINDSGDVVGYGLSSTVYVYEGFEWHDGKLTALPSLGGSSYPAAIDDKGEIAGTAADGNGGSHAVIWQNGKLTVLPGLGGTDDGVGRMNQAGQIIGYSGGDAVLWTDGKPTDLGVGYAEALNNRGQVILEYTDGSGVVDYFLYDHGRKTALPAGDVASALNDEGQIIGSYTPAGASTQHGFVWRDGKQTDLGAGVSPAAINDRGQILVDTDDNGVYGAEILGHGHSITLTTPDGPSATAGLLTQNGFVAGTDEATAGAMEWDVR